MADIPFAIPGEHALGESSGKTLFSKVLMNSDDLAGGKIGMDTCTTHQCCRPSRTIIERKISYFPLGYSVQSAYESRSERNMDEQTIEVIGTARVMGDINQIKMFPRKCQYNSRYH